MPKSDSSKTEEKSPKASKDLSDEEEVVELESKSWQDLKNNNQLIYPRPSSELLRPPAMIGGPRFPPGFPSLGPGSWLYRAGLPPPPLPPPYPGYPVGRGHELMRRLCTMNPAFAQSIIEDYIRPTVRDDDVVLEIECGSNNALMYLSRLCQGSKGPCIWFQEAWITPNEFQYISGRETAKDWKRSIRHCGKSMKLLLTKGILTTHPPICDCEGCRISSPIPSDIQMQQQVSASQSKSRKANDSFDARQIRATFHAGLAYYS